MPDTVQPTLLRARPATHSDEALLLAWANDAETRSNAFSTAPIAPESHRAWFRDRLRDNTACHIFIIEADGDLPVGQARFELDGEAWRIDYAVAPDFRNRGLGRRVLNAALQKLSELDPGGTVFGDVKKDNHASRRVFEGLGFHQREVAEVMRYERFLSVP